MKILLADDHDLFRAGLSLVLKELDADLSLLQAASLSAALTVADTHSDINLALLDLNMPEMEGARGLVQFRERFPAIPAVIVSASDDLAAVRAVLAAGASGFIHKSTAPQVMLSALRLVLAGGVYIPSYALGEARAADAGSPRKTLSVAGGLTTRQLEVLRLLAAGKPNKLIARELDLSEGTVKIHLSAIFRVLEVNNRTEAVLAAQQLNLNLKAPSCGH